MLKTILSMQQLQVRIYFINYGHSHRLSRKTLIQNTSKIFYFCILLDLCTIIHNFKGLSILKFMLSAKWNWFCFVLAKMYTWMCHGLLVMSFTLKMICHKESSCRNDELTIKARTLKRLGNKKFVQSGEVRTSRHSRKEK